MTAPTLTRSAYPKTVDELIPHARDLADQLGEVPSRNKLMKTFRVGSDKANALLDALTVAPADVPPGELPTAPPEPVTEADDGTATLSVDEWYAGGDGADTVTVTSPSEQLQDLLLAVDFQEGRSYLVSADGDRVTLCGYSGEDNAEMQALYAEAFGG